MSKKLYLGKIEELEQTLPRRFEFDEIQIAVFQCDGELFAIDDLCSHDEASLVEGDVEGCEVSCPLHGARFDIKTGKNLTLPAVRPVNAYQVVVEDGLVYVLVAEE
ncbi:MAG: non-heme iron oxygenase ferredoxin subunit [Calditrichia bacterium]